MGYFTFAITSMLVVTSLGLLLHLQFGRTGIVNFGVVGFSGLGMYTFGVLIVQAQVGYWSAMLGATAICALLSLLMGWLVRDMDGEATLVATLAFATVILHVVTTEKWLTGGVAGLGTLPYPFDLGRSTGVAFMVLMACVVVALMVYAVRLKSVPYGRLLTAINDNEPLARGLGKPTRRERLVFFTVTATAMGVVGVLFASANQFLVPRMLAPGLTFTVWIALVLGGRTKVLGSLVGVLVSVGLFDLVIEPFAPVPREYSQLMPDIKLMAFGLLLVITIMFRPHGILGDAATRERAA